MAFPPPATIAIRRYKNYSPSSLETMLGQCGGAAFNPSTGGRGRQISEFEASLVYVVSVRKAQVI